MKTLVLSNGELKETEIGTELEDLQEIVGGYIEIPFLSKVFNNNGIDVIINEEGKFIEGLKPEIVIIDGITKQMLDIVYGNCIFASHNKEGDTIGLTEEQIKVIMRELYMDVTLTYPDLGKKYKAKLLFV